MSDWRVPLSDLEYGPEEEAAVLRVLKSRWLSMGPEVQAFEREFGEMLEMKHVLAVTNGTAALHLTLLALGVGPGDEIIQPAINFVAAANMTVAVGAVPVFADILSLEEPTLDPNRVAARITARTRAVVVMHYGGYPCRMVEIRDLCRQRNLMLIEDACHAVGSRFNDARQRPPHGAMAGNLGDISCFSFFSNKNLATGEGGVVATNHDDLAQRLRLLRSHGMTTLTWDRYKGHAASYDVVSHGYNYRIDEIRAALGRAQLARLFQNNGARKALVDVYRNALADLPGWVVPFGDWRGSAAYHLMTVVAPDPTARQQAADSLRQEGVQTSLHYPSIADFDVFKDSPRDDLCHSRSFASRVLTLPLYPGLDRSDIEEICRTLRRAAHVLLSQPARE